MASEGSFSSEDTTPSRLRSPLNDIIAANLSQSFATPQRPISNSARKRRHFPNLSRSAASPSHGVHMTNIFRGASATLLGFKSPPLRNSPNSKRPRMPLSVARSPRFGNATSLATADQDETEGTFPNDGGFETPQRSAIKTPEAVTNPAFEPWRLPQFPSSNSKSASLPSSPMLIQAASPSYNTEVEAWLSGVLATQGKDTLSTPESSNKENISPATSLGPSTQSPTIHVNASACYPIMNSRLQARPLRFDRHHTPQGHLNRPPRRKKPSINDTASLHMPISCTSGPDFTIHDELADALAELSPQVERHRKGRGPKRARCKDYFDDDVLEKGGNHGVFVERRGKKPGGTECGMDQA